MQNIFLTYYKNFKNLMFPGVSPTFLMPSEAAKRSTNHKYTNTFMDDSENMQYYS